MSTYRKKVCHLTSVHTKNDIRIYHKECLTLIKAGYDVFLVVQNNKDEESNGVKIIGIDTPTNRKGRMTRIVRQVYRRALECDADIYHFHDPELIPVGVRLKKRGKKVIYDVHEDFSEDILNKEWIPALVRKTIATVFDRIERYAVQKFDGVITATPKIRKKFVSLNSNVVDINNYPIINDTAAGSCKTTVNDNNVIYIGAIGSIRGIFEMVRALEYTNATLVLVGTFTSQKDYDLARSMKGWERVDYRGQVERSEIRKILSESVAGLVLFHPGPNHDDSQPNKLFEYMEVGLPVIGSNFPLWKDIIEKNNCGLCVNPLDPYEIADAIKWVIENPDSAALMGKNGRNAVLEKYNWQTESRKLVRFYEELLK